MIFYCTSPASLQGDLWIIKRECYHFGLRGFAVERQSHNPILVLRRPERPKDFKQILKAERFLDNATKLYSSGRARGLTYDPRDICILAFALHVSHLDCYLPSVELEQFAV